MCTKPSSTIRHRPSTMQNSKSAFTLVELLVVITIIGILIALLLPAVQAAREAARRMQCTNHLKQLALGCLTHEQAHGYFPTGGWTVTLAGEPIRGFDQRQPGGVFYNILPYLEQQALRELDGVAGRTTCFSTAISTFHCPSRRAAIPYPLLITSAPIFNTSYSSSGMQGWAGRNDYAASGGDNSYDPPGGSHLTSVEAGDARTPAQWRSVRGAYTTGVFFVRSKTKIAEITDGTSSTYLLGEKYVNPDRYLDGLDPADDQGWDIGWDWDTERFSGRAADISDRLGQAHEIARPFPDTPGDSTHNWAFGSAHANSFNMAFCDGSVQSMSYSIDLETHHRLGNIADGLTLDAKGY